MRVILFVLSLAAMALGQPQQQVVVNPDCIIPFQFNAQGQVSPTNGYNNKQVGCNVWQIQYANNGFGPISLVLQSAPDNNGVPGAWGTMGGTVLFGINPNTNTTGASTLINTFGTAFPAWVRVTDATATGAGTIVGVALGFRQSGAAGGVIPGTLPSNVNVTQYGSSNVASGGLAGLFAVGGAAADGAASAGNPVLIGGHDAAGTPLAHIIQTDVFGGILPSGVTAPFSDGLSNTETVPAMAQAGASVASTQRSFQMVFNGVTWDRDIACSQQASFNLAGSGNTQIIPAGTGVLRICHLSFSTVGAEDVKVTQGTGANCVVGTADVTGLYKSVQSMALDFSSKAPLRSSANQAICLNQSIAQALGGMVIYAPAF